MKLETFFENFEPLAASPNGARKLRELILQLAVQGKLAPQDPNDEPASALLEKIRVEKERLVKEKKIRKSEPLPPIEVEEVSFELPQGWEWSRLSEVGITNPRNVIDDEQEVSFIPMALILAEYGLSVQSEKRLWKEIKGGFTHFAEGDVALAKITPCFQNGKSAVMRGLINGVGAGTTELHVFRPFAGLMSSDYVLLYLKAPYFIENGIPRMTGTAGQKRVPNDYFSNSPVPLPPLAEQHRIVAKVDQLMALCNELEARQQRQQAARVQVNNAALDRMLTARAPEEFAAHWQRVCDNFDLLYDAPETVGQLRQAVLQLAVRGKLAPQDPNDEPASALLEKIRVEKERLVKEKKIKRSEPLPPIETEDVPFGLPQGWAWARFPELGEFGRGKSKHRPRNDPKLYKSGQYRLVQTGDVARANKVIQTHTGLYNEVGLSQSRMWPKGTLCITIAANIADSGILGFDACFPDSVVGLLPSTEIGDTTYFEYFMRTAKNRLLDYAPSTAQKNINLGILETVLIPLPPLNEIRRIVAKVDQLMSLCDELEAKLKDAQAASGKLLEATVKHLLTHGRARGAVA